MKIGVIGLGYVGLPLVVSFAEAGDDVVALDVDPLKVSAVRAGVTTTSRTSRRTACARSCRRSEPPIAMRISPRPTRSSSAFRRR